MTRYDERTALIVTDIQNDFAHPEGALYVPGGEKLLDLINDEIAAARAAGAHVFYTQDWHPERTPHFAMDGGTWPVHCVGGTWGAELLDGLKVEGPQIRKGVDGGDGYSAFSVRDPVSGEESRTKLGHLLRDAGVERLVVTGLAGDWCVRSTALDGRELGYEVEVPLEATRFIELEEGDTERTIEQLEAAGVTVVPT
jgi:nicotinamidase/pyrazinamidase